MPAPRGRRPHDALPISTVSRLTGLSPDLIRAWEKRYGLVTPIRGPRGARLYAGADVERLRVVRSLVQEGRRIRDVAHLPPRALAELGASARTAASVEPPVAPAGRILESLRRYDADLLEKELGELLVALGGRRFVDDVAAPLLTALGDEWEAGRLTVADERLASESLRTLLVGLVGVRVRPGAPRIVLATPSGERHELGLLLVAILAVEAGLRPYNLGAEVPASEIAGAARRAGAVVVATSVVYRENRPRSVAELRVLWRALPPGTALWVGGRDGAEVGRALGAGRVTVLADLARTAAELERVGRTAPPPVTS
jgi:DNA-binding transcriptional MerR regulator